VIPRSSRPHSFECAIELHKLSSDLRVICYREDVNFPTLQRSFVRFVIAAPSAAACFTVSYFTPAGASIAGRSSGCLNPGYAQGFYLPNVTVTGMTDGLWSALVTADQPLVVVANATCTSCGGDNVYAYNGFAR
jgi:hypothetical protein